ncbi:MAG: glutamate 5-kinase [Victivallaceae bacterium]
MENKNISARKRVISDCRQIIVKVGTRLLTDQERIPKLIAGIAAIRAKGCRVLLVSSGAVGIGMQQLGLSKRPSKLSQVQALAALGQNKLMAIYDQACRAHGFKSAQLLLTANDLRARERHLNVLNCINALWSHDILPIVNENDSVSVDELKFGDNDILSAMVATMTRSQLTIILTTEQGLREKVDGVLGDRVSLVEKIDDKMRASAEGTDNREFSIGGMISKLRAAQLVTTAGEYLWIADGRKDDILQRVMDGEDVGTLFVPQKNQMQSRKRWIKFFSKAAGTLTIDSGAVVALRDKGRSLLPSGVVGINGKFRRGDTVEIVDEAGVVIGKGLCNFNSEDCEQIVGLQSSEIPQILKRDADEEIIHRNNLTIVVTT